MMYIICLCPSTHTHTNIRIYIFFSIFQNRICCCVQQYCRSNWWQLVYTVYLLGLWITTSLHPPHRRRQHYSTSVQQSSDDQQLYYSRLQYMVYYRLWKYRSLWNTRNTRTSCVPPTILLYLCAICRPNINMKITNSFLYSCTVIQVPLAKHRV